MKLRVNDETITTQAATVADLVAEITGTDPGEVASITGVAVAVDGAVVPRSQWDRALVAESHIDILNAVQGG